MTKSEAKTGLLTYRSIVAMLLVITIGFLLVARVFYLKTVKAEEYQAIVSDTLLSDTIVTSTRGTIYDATGSILAQSADVWLIYIVPSAFSDITDETEREETKELVAEGLAEILDLDYDTLLEYTNLTTSYKQIADEVEYEETQEVQSFISENSLNSIIGIDPDTTRYHPYSSLASTVVGFTGTDGYGLTGIESYYDDELTGTSGRIISSQDASGNSLSSVSTTVYSSQDGLNITLTLDSYVQYVLEDALSDALESTGASYAYGIVMDVNTGAIIAMASLPDYDLNDPYTISSESVLLELEAMEDATERATAKLNALYAQWRNKNISDTYEPGSVFKVITAAAALEEGVADLDTTYYCSGSIEYATRTINCWKDGGHGSETFADLLKNSCNPFAVTLADLIGTETFYEYFEAFGFTESTGVDLPGEASSVAGVLYQTEDDFSKSDLASYSFGQSFSVTPLQIITAMCAVANGGYLLTPYIVQEMTDSDGNVVYEAETTVRRQVISESTSETLCEILEEAVTSGTAKNAYVTGYRVAGKTGTSEKLTTDEEVYIASFCGFAPADDPQYALLIIIDEPVGDHGGGAVAAPIAGTVFEQILPYLGVEASYSASELESLLQTVESYVGLTVSEAEELSDSVEVRIYGDGDTIVAQYPESGRQISQDGVVILYTESDYEQKTVTVPDFSSLTVSQATALASNYGLNIKISGTSSESTVYAYSQSVDAGTTVAMGEVITVYFKTTVDVSD